MARTFRWARLWDVAALLVVAFALWKVFVAPRSLVIAASAQTAPHASFARLEGDAFHVTAARGHVLFLDFYATWCTPCKIELPLVVSWANNHAGAIVVPVDVAEPRRAAQTFAREHGLGNVALDPHGDSQGTFGVEGLPTVVVVDPQGRIRAKWQGLNPAIALAMTHAETSLSNNR
ncbi:MAG: redoxin domain-containing protein [Candidatus Eremiobacteraeota bacterium]|nr:redoxin domain-containing protein [Candidatus Eremiobacteraeota bacterium]